MSKARMTHEETQKLRDLWASHEFKRASPVNRLIRRFVVGLLDEILLRDAEIAAIEEWTGQSRQQMTRKQTINASHCTCGV